MFMEAMSDGKEEVDVNVVLVTWVSSANGLEADSKLFWISVVLVCLCQCAYLNGSTAALMGS
jgi:hypothetical protein